MKKMIIPGTGEMIEINKILGGRVINDGALEFIISKIESKAESKTAKRQAAKIAAIIWMEIIQKHPFMDANKRTATETMLLFLRKNGFFLETSTAGKVYISLKLANTEMDYDALVKWLYEKIKEVKQ